MPPIVFRMDDVGASTKLFNVYSNYKLGNFLFLKYIKPFKRWAPYNELSKEQWIQILDILVKKNFKLSVSITASWVDKKGVKIPFPEKFPEQAQILKQAFKNGVIEITNHGLTHCVVGKHLPKPFSSVRNFHREFWDWIPEDVQEQHIKKSSKILKEWLNEDIKIFVPPGNVYSKSTLRVLNKHNFKIINSSKNIEHDSTNLRFIDESNVFPFHDREVVVYGISWLEKKIKDFKNFNSIFLRDLCSV